MLHWGKKRNEKIFTVAVDSGSLYFLILISLKDV